MGCKDKGKGIVSKKNQRGQPTDITDQKKKKKNSRVSQVGVVPAISVQKG